MKIDLSKESSTQFGFAVNGSDHLLVHRQATATVTVTCFFFAKRVVKAQLLSTFDFESYSEHFELNRILMFIRLYYLLGLVSWVIGGKRKFAN